MTEQIRGEEHYSVSNFYSQFDAFRKTYNGMVNAILKGELPLNAAKARVEQEYVQLLHHPFASDCLEHNEALTEYLDEAAEEFYGTETCRLQQLESFKAEKDFWRFKNENRARLKKAAIVTLATAAGIAAVSGALKQYQPELEQVVRENKESLKTIGESALQATAGVLSAYVVGVFGAITHSAMETMASHARPYALASVLALSSVVSMMHGSSNPEYTHPHKAVEYVQQNHPTLTDVVCMPWLKK